MRALLNVIRKELAQTLRDRRIVFMLIAAPVIQLVIFGFAVDMDVDRIPTAVCDQDNTVESRELIGAFFANSTFRRQADLDDPEAAQDRLRSGRAAAVLIIPRGYARRLHRRDAPELQLILDGTDSTRAAVASNAARQILAARGLIVSSLAMRVYFNPRLSSPVYMVPGVAATLLLQLTAIITAMGLAREKEAGILEQLLVTPIHPSVLLAGKCIPFILFGLVDIMAVLVVGSLVFAVPLHGSLAVVGLGTFLYLFSTVGVGILLATFSATQQQAILGAFSFMLPAVLLSGFASPIENMPGWLQPLTLLNPMRHFVEIMRGSLLKGAGVRELRVQLAALALIGSALLTLSIARFRRQLG
jgi:ABC-2 type transport system permease protein